MSQKFSMTPIAHIHSDFAEKFGVPRQSGLVEALRSTIVFEPEFRNSDALRGIEDFKDFELKSFESPTRAAGHIKAPRLVTRVPGAFRIKKAPGADPVLG